jgi:hypothetical protein
MNLKGREMLFTINWIAFGEERFSYLGKTGEDFVLGEAVGSWKGSFSGKGGEDEEG